ncbi:hypothetical protein EYR40_002520 [Pleurotus pulmonarius]|nr:hypothetical protein EYR40_002520 [Pleurotus pulmonarius]
MRWRRVGVMKEHDLGMLEQRSTISYSELSGGTLLTDLERNVTEMSPHVTMADITDAYLRCYALSYPLVEDGPGSRFMASNGKDKYYWTQLRSVLTQANGISSILQRHQMASPLHGRNYFEKFNKHCRGFEDVCEVASKTRLLGLFLGANSKDEDQDDPLSPGRELVIGDECTLPEERVAEGQEAFDELKKLEASNFDTLNFALAYYAYALGRPEECISQLSKVPDVSHVQNHIPSIPASLRSNSLSLQVPSTVGTSLSSGSGSVASAASTVSIDEIKDGRAWAMTETIRSICLQGP